MSEPITVTIVNYNGGETIADCLQAVQSLDPPPVEVIVVDNASEDGSDELVERRFPEARLIRMASNEGPCPARNRGLQEAATRLVLQLDGDVIVTPDSLRRLLDAFHSQPGVGLVQPRALFDDDRDCIHYDGGSFHYVGVMSLRHFYGSLADARRLDPGPSVRRVDAVISLALLVDRDLVLDAGGYDPAFFILFEDHDLSYRLRACGATLLVVADAIVYHRHGTAGISYRKGPDYPRRRAWLHARNRWLVLAKNHRLWTLLVTLPGLALFDLAWFGFSLKSGLVIPFLHGKLSFLRSLGPVRRHRRRLAACRKVGDRELLGAPRLTFTPLIDRSGLMGRAERVLNALLRFWWILVRPLVR